MTTIAKRVKEFNELIYTYNRGFKGHVLEHKVTGDLQEKLNRKLSQIVRETEEEIINKAFDWIWDGWNLDLATKDRAKLHFKLKNKSNLSSGGEI